MEHVYTVLRNHYGSHNVLLIPSLKFQPEDLAVHVGSADIACLVYVDHIYLDCHLLVFSVEGHATLYDCDVGVGLEHKLLTIKNIDVL